MANKKSNGVYVKSVSKILLLVLYIFLLAPQCHSRFYSIANFYLFSVHKHNGHITAAKVNVEETVQPKSKHLSLDKRFRNTPSYSEHPQNLFNNYLAVVYYVSRQQKLFDHPVIIYSDAFVHAQSRRGPPCA